MKVVVAYDMKLNLDLAAAAPPGRHQILAVIEISDITKHATIIVMVVAVLPSRRLVDIFLLQVYLTLVPKHGVLTTDDRLSLAPPSWFIWDA